MVYETKIINDNMVTTVNPYKSRIGMSDDETNAIDLDEYHVPGTRLPFPFTRLCFSIGDWALVSALPEIFSLKYPHIDFELPSKEYLQDIFSPLGLNNWKYGTLDPVDNIDVIFKNNPFVKRRFNVGEFKAVTTDHDRIYRSNISNEPLIEQILRKFGFNVDEIQAFDSTPKLYFSDDEIRLGESIIERYCADNQFGSMLFATRRPDAFDGCVLTDNILQAMHDIKDNHPDVKYIFYYTDKHFQQTNHSIMNSAIFNNIEFINFDDIPECSDLRMQLYIKWRSEFNFGVQSGFSDAVSNGFNLQSKQYVITPYSEIGDNVIRRSHYYYMPNGTIRNY